MSQLAQNVRYAVRNLGKQRGFTLAAVVTLALAIGANTAIFSVVDAVLLTPPPFRDPGRVVVAWASNPAVAQLLKTEQLPFALAHLEDWKKESRSFDSLALVQSDRMTLTGQGEPEQLGAVRYAGDFFEVLETSPAIGRMPTPADETPGTPTVMVLSHGYWQRRFGGDPQIVGRALSLNGMPVTVVGVMPPRFAFPRGTEVPNGYGFVPDPDIWVPLSATAKQISIRGNRSGFLVGRLKAGVTPEAAQAEVQTISTRLAQEFPSSDGGWGAYLVPIQEQMVGGLRPVLLVVWAAVGLVLLIACVNVANLLLARAASRQKEIALRMAIGAGRQQLVSQLLVESTILALLGGAVGVFLAWLVLRACAAFVPVGQAGAATFTLDGRTLAFTLGVCLLASLLAGLVPAFQMTRPDLSKTLREGTRGGGGTRQSRRTRSTLVIVEVATAVVVLICAGLLLRSFVRLTNVDPGFRTQNVLSFRVDLPLDRYPAENRIRFFEELTRRVQGIPGVVDAAAVSELPMSGIDSISPIAIEGRPQPKDQMPPVVSTRSVTPTYFQTLRIPLLDGRPLQAGDTHGKALVAVVDEVFAKTFWPGENAVGKRFRRLDGVDEPITVVGVAGNVHHVGLYEEPRPTVYMNPDQTQGFFVRYRMVMVARTEGNPLAIVSSARNAVHQMDKDQPVSQIRPLQHLVDESIFKTRLGLLLLSLLAVLSLALAVVGIYGVTSYSVTQRTRELGLRMALGARPAEVIRLVVRETGALTLAGILLGLLLTFALTRVATAATFVSSLLYEVKSTDPMTFAGVGLGLALVALAAAWLPGRKATRVSPMITLRTE